MPATLRSTLEEVAGAVLVVGANGTIEFANGAAATHFDVHAGDRFVGRDELRSPATGTGAGVATADPLTGLADRAALIDALERVVARGGAKDNGFGVLFCDLDGFKLVNDVHGHEAGDSVLVAVADRLRQRLRGHDMIARFGGDEFVVLLESIDEPARAREIATRIVEGVVAPITIGDNVVQVGVSIGIAVADDDTVNAHDLLARADAAMYEAKRTGKCRVAEYSAALDQRLQERQRLARELRGALPTDQLQLWYRPVVDLATGEIGGFEASLRWQHPVRGTLTPEAFVATADSSGMMAAIDDLVLSSAARDVTAWRTTEPNAHAWVTVSGRVLMQASGASRIVETLRLAHAAAGSVGLEVSENDVAHDYKTIAPVLRQLADSGVRIALDNFYGRLAVPQLQSLRPHSVKLDRSFLERLGADIDSARAVRSVVGMIRPLGIAIVAKGVDTASQLAAVVSLNCSAAQGAIVGEATSAAGVRFGACRLDEAAQTFLPGPKAAPRERLRRAG